jgi:ATP-dependent Zn protease
LAEHTSDEATAYHEAGHAVMALALGRPVAGVSVRARREYAGTCAFGKAVIRPSEDWLERELLISLAGLAAEARHTGTYAWDAAARDQAYAEDLALQRAGGSVRKAQRLLRRMLAKAEYLLGRDGNWRAVERLAAELLRSGEVSGRAARHIYEEETMNDER